jgi:hypothetical protein
MLFKYNLLSRMLLLTFQAISKKEDWFSIQNQYRIL